MTSRPSARPPRRGAIIARNAAYLSLSLLAATALGGCPDGAELENPDRFPQAGIGGATGGATGGTGGATGGTGGATGGTAGAATGGTAGATGGSAGMAQGGAAGTMASGGAGGTVSPLCDIQVALSKSCARTGCHSALDHYADLDLSNPAGVAAQMVGVAAMHGDINCAAPGTPFRECMPSELPATCPPAGTLLIDPTTFDNSWVVKKLNGDETCGDAMPLPPGDSVSNGWNDARKACLIDFFRQLSTSQ